MGHVKSAMKCDENLMQLHCFLIEVNSKEVKSKETTIKNVLLGRWGIIVL